MYATAESEVMGKVFIDAHPVNDMNLSIDQNLIKRRDANVFLIREPPRCKCSAQDKVGKISFSLDSGSTINETFVLNLFR